MTSHIMLLMKVSILFSSSLFGLHDSSAMKCNNRTVLKLGLMGYSYIYGPPTWLSNMGSAAYLALHEVNSDLNILPCVQLNITIANTKCSSKIALDEFVQLILSSEMNAIIGLYCPSVTENVGLLASQWNIPLVRYGLSTDKLRDPVYDTIVTTRGALEYLGKMIHTISMDLKFQRICMSIPMPRTQWKYLENGMLFYNLKFNITLLEAFNFDFFKRGEYSIQRETLREMQAHCRGMILLSLNTKHNKH